MSAVCPLYPILDQRIAALLADCVPARSRTRFALLVCGILAARSTVLARVAAELAALALTAATSPASIERRLRRTLNDPHLTPATCYVPLLTQILDWPALLRGSRRVVIAVDDSSHTDRVHLLRASLTYWGGSLPLAWRLWAQNVAQPAGCYWEHIDALFAQLARVLPAELEVVIVADRAFAVPNFIDRCRKQGWHWVVRVTTTGSHRFRDARGREGSVRAVVGCHLGQAGQRWKGRGQVFKDAGWRTASVVGLWGARAEEAVVVLSDLPAQWSVLALYERRYWIEPGFRNDKTAGWQWEASQVRGVEHQERLMLGMAWASVVAVSVGVAAAAEQETAVAVQRARGRRGQVRRARESVFTQGVRGVRRWVYGTTGAELPWRIGELDGPSWLQRWHACQAQGLIFGPGARPPPARPAAGPARGHAQTNGAVLTLLLLLVAGQQRNTCSVRS